MNENLLKIPQWTTGPRLLKLGEGIMFNFFLPDGFHAEPLTISRATSNELSRATPLPRAEIWTGWTRWSRNSLS